MMDDLGSIGARVKHARSGKGMTRAALGSRVGQPESWVRGVENDRISLDKYSILCLVAETLDTELGWLLGQPYRPAEPSQDAGQSAVAALRDALRWGSLILSEHPGVRATSIPLPLPQLRGDVDRLATRLLAAELPDVMRALPELTGALNAGMLETVGSADYDVVLRLVVDTGHVAGAALNHLGFHDLAWLAVENAAAAARKLGDPLLQACNAWNRCGVLLHTGSLNAVIAVAESAMAAIEGSVVDATPEVDPAPGDPNPAALSLYGALNLRCAVASARRQDARSAWQYWQEGRNAATRLGHDRNDYRTGFGPTNVAIHGTEIAVELDQPEYALRLHESLDLRAIASKERLGRQYIDIARAFGQLEREADAIEALQAAADIAPHYTFNDPMARGVVDQLSRQGSVKVAFQLAGNSVTER
jgi:transcriptional regulator with XRE-family HTH domain